MLLLAPTFTGVPTLRISPVLTVAPTLTGVFVKNCGVSYVDAIEDALLPSESDDVLMFRKLPKSF